PHSGQGFAAGLRARRHASDGAADEAFQFRRGRDQRAGFEIGAGGAAKRRPARGKRDGEGRRERRGGGDRLGGAVEKRKILLFDTAATTAETGCMRTDPNQTVTSYLR